MGDLTVRTSEGEVFMISELAVIKINGTFDSEERRTFQHQIQSALSEKRFLVLDVSQLNELDSKGLAELFSVVAKVVAKGGDVAIIGANAKLRTLFSLVQLDRVVELCDDIHHAMNVLEAPRPEARAQEKTWLAVPQLVR